MSDTETKPDNNDLMAVIDKPFGGEILVFGCGEMEVREGDIVCSKGISRTYFKNSRIKYVVHSFGYAMLYHYIEDYSDVRIVTDGTFEISSLLQQYIEENDVVLLNTENKNQISIYPEPRYDLYGYIIYIGRDEFFEKTCGLDETYNSDMVTGVRSVDWNEIPGSRREKIKSEVAAEEL